MSGLTWVIYIALFGALIYFMMIRPSRKRADDQKQMMNAMQPGSRVMLTSGVFGTIQAIGDQQAVVELAPGVAVTVVKQAIAKVVQDTEEEFEYTDEDGHPALTIEPDEPVAAIEPADGSSETVAEEAAAVPDESSAQAADNAVKPVTTAAKTTKSSRPPAFLDATGDAAGTKAQRDTKKN